MLCLYFKFFLASFNWFIVSFVAYKLPIISKKKKKMPFTSASGHDRITGNRFAFSL